MSPRSKRFNAKTSAPETDDVTTPQEPTPVNGEETPVAQDAAADAPPVSHRAVCAECKAHVTYALLASGHGFMVLESSEPELVFGVGESGQPVCPHGHGEMQLADEQIPAVDAISQVAEQVNGSPEQRALFDTRKPFNMAGALDAIAEKNRAVKWAHDRYEESKADTADAKKTWEREAKQLQELIDELESRRQAKETAAEEGGDEAQEPAGEALSTEPVADMGDDAFTSETPADAETATV